MDRGGEPPEAQGYRPQIASHIARWGEHRGGADGGRRETRRRTMVRTYHDLREESRLMKYHHEPALFQPWSTFDMGGYAQPGCGRPEAVVQGCRKST